MRKILITGGAGFIGTNLVRMCLDRGYRVTVFDDLSTGRAERLGGLPVDLVRGSVLDADHLQRVLPGHDGVIHLAAQTGVPGSIENPRLDCEVNIVGTLNVLEAVRLRGSSDGAYPRVVFASSNAPLGRQKPPAAEDKAPLPISPYGASKLAGEAYCLAYFGSWGIDTVVLRFANVYGPYSDDKGSVVAKFFKDIATLGEVTIDGDGGQTRDFIFVEDLCRAALLALDTENVGGEVFQIATGKETSIKQLADLILSVVGRDVAVQHGKTRQGDIRTNYSSIRKAREVLGWSPEVPLTVGVHRTWDWFQGGQRDDPAATQASGVIR